MLKHTLDNSATELVDTHFEYFGFKGFYNELNFFRINLFDNLLDYMITVGVLNTVNNPGLDLLNDLILKAGRQNIKCLLNNSATVLVARKFEYSAL
jgi:hypothetical protein